MSVSAHLRQNSMTECRLRDAESIAKEKKFTETDDDIAETEDGWLIISGWYVWILEYALTLRKGIVCIRDEKTGMHMPDEAVTVIQKNDDTALFYVHGSPAEAVSLWTDGDVTESEAGELICWIGYPVR